ncbi:Phosphatidylinositol 3-/4-kinase, catalytic domain [Dillenia turbinata]|uniref:1-phosphatidylinositol 4-kinase n=1 Tax=Dillenia turbinata TaxID=194707 RepID=A0AAN8W776_9MAGN
MAVAINRHHEFKPILRHHPRCRLQSFTHLDYMLELSQNSLTHTLQQAVDAGVANFHRSLSTPCLSLAAKGEEDCKNNPKIEIIGSHGMLSVRTLVVEVAIAMAVGVVPKPVANGLSGAYFLCNQNGNNIAVIKPVDEEPLAVNNPNGFVGRLPGQTGLKRAVRVGETGIRELAAYLIDHGGFASVPPTALVKVCHSTLHVNDSTNVSSPPFKIASLQRFVDHESDAGDLGPSGFSVSSVHRIGTLDIRLLNLDRHAGNILVKKHVDGNYAAAAAELVPIDHGLCLPEWLDDPYFEWLHWPQSSVPFTESEVEYISNIDPFKDAELLRTELPSLRESSLRVLVVCTIFLKQAVAFGLCLAEIGEMMTRKISGGEEDLSVLENVCAQVMANPDAMSSMGDDNHIEEETEENEVLFQFDIESEGVPNEVVELPGFQQRPGEDLKSNVPTVSTTRPLSAMPDILTTLQEEDDLIEDEEEIRSHDEKENDHLKPASLMRSASFAAPQYNHENEGISFGEMSEEEWSLFLENFEKFLPKVFEDAKNLMCSKQRLGNSCEF